MRRLTFSLLGLLELAVGGILIFLGCQLPSTAEVNQSFASADRVTQRAHRQIHILRQQVQGVRRLELQQLAERTRTQTRTVTATLKAQQVDFDTVRTMRDALGDVAAGLNGLAETLDPDALGKLSTGLGETATFLDDKVVPGARQAAEHLEKSTDLLRADAQRLSELLRQAPLDLKGVREIHDSLARFGKGLDQMNAGFKVQRLNAMREGFDGLESSLTTGAEQVERLAGYSYPVMTVSGLKMQIDQRPFWPEGQKIAAGMRKAATGVNAAGEEMETMAAELPKLRASLDESRKVVDRTREALAVALEQQHKVEPLLKDVPAHAARLAERLPKLGADLARILRDTRRLSEVAAALRQAQKGLDTAVARWPQLRTTLGRLATALQMAQQQLDQAVTHREEYEAALRQTVLLADAFTALLPVITDQLDVRLDEEERALEDLGQSLTDVREAMPVYAQTTSRLLLTGRLLAWLAAAVVGLHGCHLLLSARMGRRYSL